ncbi:hypothetical protein [Spirilliplanes yamanashiensis]|uniref:Uncharacterized protein n=1 Tax=Spirilliplanes yamanashiensis TaxID=42233 RepID=A0A8J3YE54_9ACTN|nr:hypothetical protein [Spirilliplanes yamanashiensis]MDP9816752.1 hypothetical protein [Spirilliplanes yamanashiensis]GIJ06275.1 hypothetical protein Sya03_56270 [Spirilliplanes yamanashiensis]
MRFDVVTKASPGQVRDALTDFTDRRLRIWNRTLDPKTYELRDRGDTWAVARESSPGSPFWVVSRYDWSDPAVIRWTIVESSYGGGGDGFARIEPAGDGGSRLHVEWENTGARAAQRAMLVVLHRGPMGRLVARMWAAALDRYAAAGPG